MKKNTAGCSKSAPKMFSLDVTVVPALRHLALIDLLPLSSVFSKNETRGTICGGG
jgi:hypothetical protein